LKTHKKIAAKLAFVATQCDNYAFQSTTFKRVTIKKLTSINSTKKSINNALQR